MKLNAEKIQLFINAILQQEMVFLDHISEELWVGNAEQAAEKLYIDSLIFGEGKLEYLSEL